MRVKKYPKGGKTNKKSDVALTFLTSIYDANSIAFFSFTSFVIINYKLLGEKNLDCVQKSHSLGVSKRMVSSVLTRVINLDEEWDRPSQQIFKNSILFSCKLAVTLSGKQEKVQTSKLPS